MYCPDLVFEASHLHLCYTL